MDIPDINYTSHQSGMWINTSLFPKSSYNGITSNNFLVVHIQFL
ncbi:hypothetical protein NLO413_0275 [Candidatus Neoehrlichia lotoris str. RAC413]|uniref:Uncharacterized protein n=1 Tax=Candidatus Neoehrlichia procyonis str. RAC413 TaxID=1359163 RepID=A0A0F3NPR1_9RICK|nr:hypothetical protein NLO413_0275 [Candidatus Neoehrlichia lotoris str. RAC413]